LRLPVAEREVGLRKNVAHVSPRATSDARSTGRPDPLSVHELSVVARSIGEKDTPCQKQNGAPQRRLVVRLMLAYVSTGTMQPPIWSRYTCCARSAARRRCSAGASLEMSAG